MRYWSPAYEILCMVLWFCFITDESAIHAIKSDVVSPFQFDERRIQLLLAGGLVRVKAWMELIEN